MVDAVQEVGGSIEAILFCPHGPDEGCDCRKPRPGLYREIAKRTQQTLQDVPIVGDSARDIEAAIDVMAQPILVLTGKGRAESEQLKRTHPEVPVFKDLISVTDALIKRSRTKR
jgi:D-glycero-D-manno-heptose 1,7-bisphosphate phosphatase